MTFEFREISQQEYLDLYKPLRPHPEVYVPQRYVVEDKEREAIIMFLGGNGGLDPSRGEPPNHYCLILKGASIPFEGYIKFKGTKEGVTILLNISKIRIPANKLNDIEVFSKIIGNGIAVADRALSRADYPIEAHVAIDGIDPY